MCSSLSIGLHYILNYTHLNKCDSSIYDKKGWVSQEQFDSIVTFERYCLNLIIYIYIYSGLKSLCCGP